MIRFFVKIAKAFQALIIFVKKFHHDVSLGPEYVSKISYLKTIFETTLLCLTPNISLYVLSRLFFLDNESNLDLYETKRAIPHVFFELNGNYLPTKSKHFIIKILRFKCIYSSIES